MPFVVEGIGTWHWGKSKVFVRNDRCEFCGNHGPLKSYDTSNFFVVFFIPIIPLGRKRVINHCPRCDRFRVSSLSRWEEQKTDTLVGLLREWRQDQRNSDKACRALAATVLYQDAQAFDDIAEPVVRAIGPDRQVLGLLAEAYELFGRRDQAEAALRDALARATPEQADEARGDLAGFLLRANRPAEAEPLLRDVLDRRHRPGAPAVLALAGTYVDTGENEQARRVLDELGTAFPDMLSTDEFEHVRKAAARKPRRWRTVDLGPQRVRPGRRLAQILGAATVLAAVLAIYVGIGISKGRNRQVYLVNGLDRAYRVQVNGQERTLPPQKAVPVGLAEGEVSVVVTDASLGIEPQTLQIHTPLLTRPFKRTLFVLNPDRTAPLVWEEQLYAVSPPADAEVPVAVHVNESLYRFDAIDYAFIEAPEQISLPSESSVVRKHRLSVFPKLPPPLMYHNLSRELGEGPAKDWMRRRAAYALDDAVMLGTLAAALGPEETIDFLRAHLGNRPVQVEVHRTYQHLVEQNKPDHDLAGEYRQILAANPGNSALIYLLARVLDDRDEAMSLFVQASQGESPCAHAYFALAGHAMRDADFDQGLAHLRRALAIDPDSQLFRETEKTALEATGQYEECLKLNRAEQADNQNSFALVEAEVYLLARAGNADAARQRAEDFCRYIDKHVGPASTPFARSGLMATIHYVEGNIEPFCQAVEQAAADPRSDGPSEQAAPPAPVLISRGRLDEAEAAFVSAANIGAHEHLALYIAARKAGRDDLAERCMQRAIDGYRKGMRGERRLAEVLAAGAVPDDRILHEVAWTPLERCILMTALGLRYPEQREQFFALARRQNVTKRFPAHLLSEVLGGAT